MDLSGVRPAGEAQVSARHRLRSVRLFDRAQDRAGPHCRLRGAARRAHGEAHGGEPPYRGGAGRDPGKDPRLRPRQDASPQGRQGRRSRAARPVPCWPGAAPQGGGVGRTPMPKLALIVLVALMALAGIARAETAVPDRLVIGYDNEGKIDASPQACLAHVKEITLWDKAQTEKGARDVCTARKRHVEAHAALQSNYKNFVKA